MTDADDFMDGGDTTIVVKPTIQSGYKAFLEEFAVEQIDEINAGTTASVIIPYSALAEAIPEGAENLIDFPEETLDSFTGALADILIIGKSYDTEEEMGELRGKLKREHKVRFIGLPTTKPIRAIRNEDVNQIFCIEGMVRTISEVKSKMVVSVWRCPDCGTLTRVIQEPGSALTKPESCSGCPRRTLRLRESMSIKQDAQLLRIQERPEGLRGGELPQALFVELTDDLCGVLNAGSSVKIVGVLKAYIPAKQDTAFCEQIFIANSIELNHEEYEDLEITDEDKAVIDEIAHHPQVYDRITQSMAPAIYGNDPIKEAIALQLFGGIAKHTKDGSRLRGDINVLIVSDPGQAKSQMLRYVAKLAPRSVLTTGNASTKAGLTATAVKDDFGDGRWTLEAGAMVLADRGCCLYENQAVVTSKGICRIKDIAFGDLVVVHQSGFASVTNIICNGEKPLYRVSVKSGHDMFLTADHKVLTEFGWKEVQDLSRSDYIISPVLYPDLGPFDQNEFNLGKKDERAWSSPWRIIGRLVALFASNKVFYIHGLPHSAGEIYINDDYADILLQSIGIPCIRKGGMVHIPAIWPYMKLAKILAEHLPQKHRDHYFPHVVVVDDAFPDTIKYGIHDIEYWGIAPVYDIQVDHPDHNFWIPGGVVHNCIIDEFDKMNESDRSSLHEAMEQNCYDDQTQVLTNTGWKLFKDVEPTDKVATLNPKYNRVEWHVPYQYIEKPYTGRMVQFKSDEIDLLVTPNHNMYVDIKSPCMFSSYQLIRADAIPDLSILAFITDDPPFRHEVMMFGHDIMYISYTGSVYCVEVENHIIYVRRGDGVPVWCGNTVSVAKAGICATLQARCAVLAAANPQHGRFDPLCGMAEQINMIPSLLSRFDLIFTMTDTPSEDRDIAIANHILNVHEVYGSVAAGTEYDDAMMASVSADIPPDMMRKYIAYARQTVIPVLSKDARGKLLEYYVSLRRLASDSNKPVPVTARQIEALIRLAEASAKVRLSSIITSDDADRVIRIVDACLKCIAYDPETGELDADRIETGQPKSKRDKLKTVMSVLKTMCQTAGTAVMETDFISELTLNHGMDSDTATEMIDQLHRETTIIRNKGRLRPV